jgi:hypothetical protein
MNQALYAHMNNKRKMKKKKSAVESDNLKQIFKVLYMCMCICIMYIYMHKYIMLLF